MSCGSTDGIIFFKEDIEKGNILLSLFPVKNLLTKLESIMGNQKAKSFWGYLLIVGIIVILFNAQTLSCQPVVSESIVKADTVYLWNGLNLDGLKLVLKKKNPLEQDAFIIKDGALHFFDTQIGYFLTEEIFENYKLHAEWRWPEENENGNSGILLHVQLPDTVWPQCIQVQLKHENAGDLIAMNGATISGSSEVSSGTIKKMNDSSEKPLGGWNESDIVCLGDSICVQINGQLQNEGTKMNLRRGRIGFQLEGKPIEFKNIFLVKL